MASKVIAYFLNSLLGEIGNISRSYNIIFIRELSQNIEKKEWD
jgi:hypothetical protein